MHLFHEVAHECSRNTTEKYSTSFFSSVRLLHKDIRQPIFNIYGFVRFADEIVDTFHEFDKESLLSRFKTETFDAIERGISLNPVLHSFQRTVNQYGIGQELIEAFFASMEMDLHKQHFSEDIYNQYIYGSAEVVGLMCLRVFCEGDSQLYDKMKEHARSLGAAFQKVNFLRDIKADVEMLNRKYFPGIDFENFTSNSKKAIEAEIERDFEHAYAGILMLPWKARFGVYVAYKYYLSLFKKIKKVQPSRIMEVRVRIPNYLKAMILVRAGVKNQLKMI